MAGLRIPDGSRAANLFHFRTNSLFNCPMPRQGSIAIREDNSRRRMSRARGGMLIGSYVLGKATTTGTTALPGRSNLQYAAAPEPPGSVR